MASRSNLLAASKAAVIEDFFRLTQEADEARELETSSAVRCQSTWRGHIVRRLVEEWNGGALHIERIYRGHRGRVKAGAERRERNIYWQEVYFASCAITVQKWFRGFHSRRYTHNYYARKAYIQAVMDKSETLRHHLEGQLQDQVEATIEERERDARTKVEQLSAKLHHLVSTKTTPGIYNSPMHDGFLPTAFSIPVEEHLRHAIKPELRESMRRSAKGKLTNTKPKLNVRGNPPGAEPFVSAEELRLEEDKSSRLGFVAGTFYTSTQQGRTFTQGYASIQAGTPYIDGGTKYLGRTVDKNSWVSSKPFHTAVPRNKLIDDE